MQSLFLYNILSCHCLHLLTCNCLLFSLPTNLTRDTSISHVEYYSRGIALLFHVTTRARENVVLCFLALIKRRCSCTCKIINHPPPPSLSLHDECPHLCAIARNSCCRQQWRFVCCRQQWRSILGRRRRNASISDEKELVNLIS